MDSSYTQNINIAFHIFGYPIHSYSLVVFIAIVVTISTCLVQAKKRRLPLKPLETFAILAIIVGFIGARVWYLIGSPTLKIHSFIDVIAVWKGGIAIEGAIVFNSILTLVYFPLVAKKYKVDTWKYIDIIMINLLLGQAIGRWGNFFNQEILGPQTTRYAFPIILLPNFIVDHLHLQKDPLNIIRQPLFLYESILSLFAWLGLTFGFPNCKYKFKSGTYAFSWFLWYGLIRAIMETFRDKPDILIINGVPVSVIISVIFLIVGIIFILTNENIIKWKYWHEKVRLVYDKSK